MRAAAVATIAQGLEVFIQRPQLCQPGAHVVLAALGVFGTGSARPDLAVAAVMAGLAIWGGWSVLQQARHELRTTHLPPAPT